MFDVKLISHRFLLARAFFGPLVGVGFWPRSAKSFPFLSFSPSEAVVWFHITSCWHMLHFKPIRVFIHVWSDWPMPLWRGWPHASLSPVLHTIWQWGVFFSHSLSVSLQSDCFLFHFFISSVSEYLAFHSFFLFFLTFLPHVSWAFTRMAPASVSTLSFSLCYFKRISLPSASESQAKYFFPSSSSSCTVLIVVQLQWTVPVYSP